MRKEFGGVMAKQKQNETKKQKPKIGADVKPVAKKRGRPPKSIAALENKLKTEGIGALTFAEVRQVQGLKKMREREASKVLTLNELEALAAAGNINKMQMKDLIELRRDLEKKSLNPVCAHCFLSRKD